MHGKPLRELVAMGVIAGLIAFGLALAVRPPAAARTVARSARLLEAHDALFDLHPTSARLSVRSRDGGLARDLDLALVVDGTVRTLVLGRGDVHPVAGGLRATFPVPLDDATVEATLDLRPDPAHDALAVELTVVEGPETAGHALGLRAELSSEGEPVFVPGIGGIADRAVVTGGALVVDGDPHPLGVASALGPVTVEALIEETQPPGTPMRVAVTSPPKSPGPGGHVAELHVALGTGMGSLWKTFADLGGVATAPVHGRVTGTNDPAVVIGRDAQGAQQVRVRTTGGAFALDVPATVVEWYATVDPGWASAMAPFTPGTPRDLLLDISPGGDLKVSIIDADTHQPLTARLLVRGVDGTVDPNFGPDYRASGAGPLMDALRGDVTTPLPSGRYRVAATRGIEWSVDAKVIDITPGRMTDLVLAPRHVVPTPGVLGCDLHVHARPSFDAPVTPEDRVLSLAAAGIDFAVPTEHNAVGDYTGALEGLDLRSQMLSVTGVEVTTVSKGFGHFGVFPYPKSLPVPPFKHTTMNAIFKAVRAGDPNRYFQLNHPRLLPKGIGYFSCIGFDPRAPRSRIHNRIDFDGIEVYNGYDDERPERVDQVLKDYWSLLNFGWRYVATGSSDSHRIQYHWAGYPRTMVTVDPAATTEDGDTKVDPLTVVANIKHGHATVTSGPIVELELGGVHPGDEIVTPADPVAGHLRVRAAPWIDVTRIEIVVGGKVVQSFELPSRPTQIGPEPGTLAEATARAVRFDQDIEVAVGPDNGWVQVIARGTRPMDDVLPFMPVPPLAFTNPVYVVRKPTPPPPFPSSQGVAATRP